MAQARKPKRPRTYASATPFQKRPARGPSIARPQPPPMRGPATAYPGDAAENAELPPPSRGRWVKKKGGWVLVSKKKARKSPKKGAAKNRAAGSKAVLARKNADKKKAIKAEKKAKKRATSAGSGCQNGQTSFLFAVDKKKRCTKGIKVGEVVDERGKSKGIEVREVAVRCGRGNRKVRCGGTRSF